MIRFVVGVLLVGATSLSVFAQAVVAAAPGAQVQTAAQPPEQINVSFDNTPLREAILTISKRAGVRVLFADDLLPFKKVTYKASGVTPSIALDAVLSGTNIRASRGSTGTFQLSKKSATDKDVKSQGVVIGKVTDAKSGKGVSGATVSVGNDTRGVTTDEDGFYRLTGVSTGTQTVSVRLVGYSKQSRSVAIGEGATVTADFKLEPTASVLDQIVVTGTVVATEVKAIPNAISVITAKQIEERGITRIDQLFRGNIPGLFSLNLGSGALLDEVTMFSRGATALTNTSSGVDQNTNNTNPIKTYIDGVEMVNPQYLSQIDPSSIERIEILTGPQASTIYGSNAINGVMQIFTKRGMGNRPKLVLSHSSGVTQNNFSSAVAPNHLTDASITGTEGRISYNVGGSWNYVGSWTPGKQTQRLSAYGGGRGEWGKLTTDLSVRRGLTKSKQNGNVLQGVGGLRAAGIWQPDAVYGAPTPQVRALNGRTVGLTVSYRPLFWWSHEVTIGSDASERERMATAPAFGRFPAGGDTTLFVDFGTDIQRSERYNTTAQLPITSVAKFNLTLGADHSRTFNSSWQASPISLSGSFSSADAVSVTRDKPSKNTGAFAQGQLSIADVLFFTYGIRADWNPNFGEDVRVVPGRYGVSYVRDIGPISAKLRGSYGRSIKPPAPGLSLGETATEENFGSDLIAQFGNFQYPKANPDLAPEHQQGGEGGIELYFGSRSSLVVTRFNQTVDNLISRVQRGDSVRSLTPVFPNTDYCDYNAAFEIPFDDEGHCFFYQEQYLNVGSIRNQGWEMQGSMNIGPLTTRGTYSWVKSRVIGVTPKYKHDLAGSAFEPGRPFDYLPEHTWALGFTYAKSRSTVSLSVNGVGMRYSYSGAVNSALGVAASASRRIHLSRPRMQDLFSIYHPLHSGYATADLNATHRFSSRIDATLQVTNITNDYQNDYSVQLASPGRSSRAGLRIRW